MRQAPEIRTGRLILRPHRLDDFEAMAAMWADPCVVRHIGGRAFARAETWQRLLRHPGQWSLLGLGGWAVEEAETGEYCGEAGFLEAMRDIEPGFGGAPETGWALRPAFHGKGYATEAMSAALAWADAHLSADRTVCIIDAGNAGSIRVAEKLGYLFEHEADFRGAPIDVYARPRAGRA
jgi:RimJ/RimL family protein N-acetyltransferase